ncbi:MAG: hypothetical protein R2864_08525 [Syntrophotaleaceae bacterium]
MVRAVVLGLLIVSLSACGGAGFKIDKQEYRQRVRTLGVVPLLVDGNSHLEHPRAQEVVGLLRRSSAGQHQNLVEFLKHKKGYFDVRPVAGDAPTLFGRLVQGRVKQDGDRGTYYHYSFNARAVAELSQRHSTDALLVVILNGVERSEKRWNPSRLTYLEAPYNSILVTAAVIMPNGEIVWESPGGEAFLELQYPAFEEAYFNKADEVAVTFITLEGLERYFDEPGQKWFQGTGWQNPIKNCSSVWRPS